MSINIPTPAELDAEVFGANAGKVADLLIAAYRVNPKEGVPVATVAGALNGWWDVQREQLIKILFTEFSAKGWNLQDGDPLNISPQ